MDYFNAYRTYIVKSINKNKTSHNYLKSNKNQHFSSSNLYYYFDKNENSFESTSNILTANLTLLKQDLFEELEKTDDLYHKNEDGSYTINNEKAITEVSLEKLKKIYQTKFEEFEKDNLDDKFLSNLFDHYTTAFKSSVEPLNKEIVKKFNESTKTNDKLDNLSYNEYKRSGVDYFDASKKIYNGLIGNLDNLIASKIEVQKSTDQQRLDSVVLFYLNEMRTIFVNKAKGIIAKLEEILTNNKLVIKKEEVYSDYVKNYLRYMNFIYFSSGETGFYRDNENLNFILRENYKGNISMLILLLKKYGYVTKYKALELCESLSNPHSSHLNSSIRWAHHSTLRRNNLNLIDSKIITIFSLKLKQAILHDNTKEVIHLLQEYEDYSVLSPYYYDTVLMLNLYALIKIIDEKIYEDYLSIRNFSLNYSQH